MVAVAYRIPDAIEQRNRTLAEAFKKRGAIDPAIVPDELAGKRHYLATAAEVREMTEEDGLVEIEAVINTDEVDRYGTIVDPAGCITENYLKNPVLLWAHGCDFAAGIGTMPIGEVVSLQMSGSQIIARIRFFDTKSGSEIGE